jgi:hypothetical protein
VPSPFVPAIERSAGVLFGQVLHSQILFVEAFLQMQKPFSVGLSPSIGFDFRSGVQSRLKMLLTKPSLHWRSIEKPDAFAVATTWIAADSFAHSQLTNAFL